MAGLTVYGALWCGDCRRSKRLLDRLHVPYTWIDVDQDEDASELVRTINGGSRAIPVIVFPDGHHLTEPADRDLLNHVEDAGLVTL